MAEWKDVAAVGAATWSAGGADGDEAARAGTAAGAARPVDAVLELNGT